jgi:hypothetical protein
VFTEFKDITQDDGSVIWTRVVLDGVKKIYTEYQGAVIKLEVME